LTQSGGAVQIPSQLIADNHDGEIAVGAHLSQLSQEKSGGQPPAEAGAVDQALGLKQSIDGFDGEGVQGRAIPGQGIPERTLILQHF